MILSMKKYNSFDKGKSKPWQDNKRSDDRRGGGNSRSAGKPEMHPAICSECKTKTEVPFKPAYGKPVRCRECFGSTGQERGRESGGQGSREYKGTKTNPNSDMQDGLKRLEKQLIGISAKMEQIIAIISEDSHK